MFQKKSSRKKNALIGRFGEKIAQDYLLQKGYELIEKNYHCPGGEIDIIVKKNDILVFVEVKTRLYENFGPGEAAFNSYKKHKLLRTIFNYLTHKTPSISVWRLDLIAIQLFAAKNKANIKHFSNILVT